MSWKRSRPGPNGYAIPRRPQEGPVREPIGHTKPPPDPGGSIIHFKGAEPKTTLCGARNAPGSQRHMLAYDDLPQDVNCEACLEARGAQKGTP